MCTHFDISNHDKQNTTSALELTYYYQPFLNVGFHCPDVQNTRIFKAVSQGCGGFDQLDICGFFASRERRNCVNKNLR